MIFTIRHGQRCDRVTDPQETNKIINPHDVPITTFGHEMAYKTGLYLSEYLTQQKQQNKCPSNTQFIILSSPYYRCLQTSRQIAMGVKLENLHNQTIYVEDGLRELYAKFCVQEDTFETFLLKTEWPMIEKEIFTDLKCKRNQILDYENNPLLTPKYGEGFWPMGFEGETTLEERFKCLYEI